ncbi:MAG: hypothetical protein KF836_01460 [Fimbriimonadaceae bacterium]|nr:hypothetical protein [Fimbriimonadaceae bacterium]
MRLTDPLPLDPILYGPDGLVYRQKPKKAPDQSLACTPPQFNVRGPKSLDYHLLSGWSLVRIQPNRVIG